MIQTIDKIPLPQGMEEWQWTLAQVQLLLINGGYKEATSIYMPTNAPNAVETLENLSAQLTELGFSCRINLYEERGECDLNVAKNDQALERLEACLSGTMPLNEAHLLHGQLSGFPDSAIKAYITGSVIDSDTLPQSLRVSPEYTFAVFRLSKEHWKEELETGKKWASYIKSEAPDLYKQYLDQFTE